MFQNDRERAFYDNGKDMDFVKYHKRVTRNFKETLQELVLSQKQTIAKGIQDDY